MTDFTIISCYTDDEVYLPEAEALKNSIKKVGLSAEHINVMPNQGSWEKNCQYKPVFIREKLLELSSPVVWIDVDAIIQTYPSLFEGYDFDVGLYFPEKNKKMKLIMSGTMYFSPKDLVLSMLQDWEEFNKTNNTWDQINLRTILYGRSMATPMLRYNLSIGELPHSYCSTDDHLADNSVISHKKISKENKNND